MCQSKTLYLLMSCVCVCVYVYIWVSLVTQKVKNVCAMREIWINPWVGKIPWRRTWQPNPVFLPGEFHAQRSLVGYSPWGHKESDTTELLCIYIISFFFFTAPCGMRDLSYLTRDRTHDPCIGSSES